MTGSALAMMLALQCGQVTTATTPAEDLQPRREERLKSLLDRLPAMVDTILVVHGAAGTVQLGRPAQPPSAPQKFGELDQPCDPDIELRRSALNIALIPFNECSAGLGRLLRERHDQGQLDFVL